MTRARETTLPMRRMLQVAAALVFIIGLPTYLFPEETHALFSWTVNPPLTAAFLGGAYLTSMFVELLASRERHWSNARIAVPAVLFFTVLTSIVTLRHLDTFHFGSDHSAFTQLITWVWLVVYLVVPPVLGVLWWLQTRSPGGELPREAPMPAAIKGVLGLHAALMLGVGAALYLAPETVADDLWPWKLSALTGGAVGAWLLGVGLGVGHAVGEGDLRRVRAWMVAYLLFGALELAAVARFAGDEFDDGTAVLDWGGPRIWVFVLVGVSIIGVSAWALAALRSAEG